jgi:hypothetical protein
LNRVHYVGLLGEKGVPQLRRPLDVAGHALQRFRIRGHRLNARLPWLFSDGIHQRLVLQIFVSFQPLLKLNDFEWISGRSERLGEERIRIQGNRRNQRIQLIIRNLASLFRGRGRRCGCHDLRLRLLRRLRQGKGGPP